MSPNSSSAQERPLRFPEGGVWALRHPAQVRSVAPTTRHAAPMPGDLTTDRVLDEAQRGLERVAADIDELNQLIGDVLFRFPGSGAGSIESDESWPPAAA